LATCAKGLDTAVRKVISNRLAENAPTPIMCTNV